MVIQKVGPPGGYPYNEEIEYGGLTYREWLIGMIASGNKSVGGDLEGNQAILIIKQADAIIRQLDEESR